jgi:fumarylacetoacetase
MNSTTDPALRSWVPVAADSHFPIQNLPYGVFSTADNLRQRIGVAIGDFVLDLQLTLRRTPCGQRIEPLIWPALDADRLNMLALYGPMVWREVRTCISELLRAENPTLRDAPDLRNEVMFRRDQVRMHLPFAIGDYTDFYSSREHATNVGTMLRGPDNALMPNWLHLPVAYHGRASSVVVSGTDPHRPRGQTKADDAAAPTFGPSRALDFELEMGFFVGPGNALGEPIPVGRAAEHIFGMVLVNDWSARDIQKWEYVPLGPFLAKNFCTSISPWVVPLEALEPFRTAGPVQQPPPLPYLQGPADWAFDIHLEAHLQTAQTERPHVISKTNSKYLYWNVLQQLAHHTVNGCNLCPGDLLASGTISGPAPDSFGSLLELAWGGKKPLTLPGGATRTFLQDGDRLTLTGWCQGQGYRVGFGEVTGQVLPARS